MKRRTAAARLLLFAAGGALAGALGVLLVERPYEPLPPLHAEDYGFTRQSGDAFVIDPQRILSVPFAFPDFDLFAQVTLSEGAELDVVLRRVEPQLAGDPFHGRWVLARLSTRQAGPVVRSREAAVFADDVPGGHRLAPGRAATLTVMARGRRLRANLAGVWYELEASDAHGALAFVARHGPVEIDLLEVHNLGRPLRLLPFAWGAILGAGFGLLAAALGARAIRAVFATLAVPAFGYAAALLITAFHLPQVEPRTPALLALGLAGAPLAVLLATARGRPRAVALRSALGIVVALLAFEVGVRLEAPRLAPLEDPRLDGLFGWGSGTAPFDRLARRVSSRQAIHLPGDREGRVFFLGGSELFEGGPERGQWVAPLAVAAASPRAGRRLVPVVMPALWGDTRQQVDLLLSGYLDWFEPAAIVLAVPPWEGEPLPAPVRRIGEGPPPRGASRLLDLWRGAREGPATDAADLGVALELLRAGLAERGTPLVLARDPDLAPGLAAVVDEFARRNAVPLVVEPLLGAPAAVVEALAAALARALS